MRSCLVRPKRSGQRQQQQLYRSKCRIAGSKVNASHGWSCHAFSRRCRDADVQAEEKKARTWMASCICAAQARQSLGCLGHGGPADWAGSCYQAPIASSHLADSSVRTNKLAALEGNRHTARLQWRHDGDVEVLNPPSSARRHWDHGWLGQRGRGWWLGARANCTFVIQRPFATES